MSNRRGMTIDGPGTVRLSRDGRTVTVSIPITLRHLKGRKRVLTPTGTTTTLVRIPIPGRVDSTLVKAIVRAHRWRNMLESRLFASVRDLAKAEKINESYLCRMLRLTLLSPAITESILEGTQPEDLELTALLERLPSEWELQAAYIAGDQSAA